MKVEMIKHPTEEDWAFCKECTLNTVGKIMVNAPTDEWKIKLLNSEHSPIRTLWFAFKMEIPYWVSVHLVRHKIGVEHFVSTQRDDRNAGTASRADAPQGTLVSHLMYINAAELVQFCHKRLCAQASPETREVAIAIVKEVLKTNPEFKSVLVPLCEYRNGLCTEFKPCGRFNKNKNDADDLK